MFFKRRKEQERKRRLFGVEVEKEECFELGRGLDGQEGAPGDWTYRWKLRN